MTAPGALARLGDAWRGVHRQQGFVFEVTARCNHACDHCYNVWTGRGAPPVPAELDTRSACEVLAQMLDQTGARSVTLSGGEPLLRPDLFELVDFLARRGVSPCLVTNGRLLGRDAVRRLAGKVSVFELPLLSARREVHDAMSRAPGAFDRVTEAIADLKLAGQHVVAVFVATRRNLADLAATAELAFALGVDGLMLNRFNPGGRGRDHVDALLPDPDEVRAALAAADEVAGRLGLPISCSIAIPPCLVDTRPFTNLTFGFCAAGTERAYFTVDPVGNVRPCNHSPTVLGSLVARSFRSMARGRAMRAFAAALPAHCADCGRRAECAGSCKAAAEACSGSAHALEPFVARHRDRVCKPP